MHEKDSMASGSITQAQQHMTGLDKAGKLCDALKKQANIAYSRSIKSCRGRRSTLNV